MALKIAINLYRRIRTKRYRSRRRQSFRILFSKEDHPDSSITSEQSVQILKYALFMFENHKDYLKVMFAEEEAFRKHMEEYEPLCSFL